jgi:hypothetical protein
MTRASIARIRVTRAVQRYNYQSARMAVRAVSIFTETLYRDRSNIVNGFSMRSRADLINVISKLPARQSSFRRSQKENWLNWLAGHDDYPRIDPSRDARTIYNALSNPDYIIWLAAAAGMSSETIKQAVEIAAGTIGTRGAKAAAVRKIIPWSQMSEHLSALDQSLGDLVEQEHQPIDFVSPTTTQALIDARIGQDRFRANLEARWDGSCAVTGCGIMSMLRASHIKPWIVCTDLERLDTENGLLLAAHIDALFDRGIISFENDGRMLLSHHVGLRDRMYFRLPKSLRRRPSKKQARFLEYHRQHRFEC